MFRLLTQDSVPEYLAFCEGRLLGAVLYTRLLAYGPDDGKVMFWLARGQQGLAAASLFDGVFTADYDQPGFAEEAKAFGSFLGAGELITPEYFARNGFRVMTYRGSEVNDFAADISPEHLKEVFAVLYEDEIASGAAPEYGLWLTDISHKLRHGLIRGKCKVKDNNIVSVALTSGETETSAVLSGVATLRGYRGNGYAALAVRSLSGELSAENKKVYAIIRPELAGFYRRSGFV